MVAKIFLLKDGLEKLALPLGKNEVGRSGRAPLLLGTAAEASDVFADVFHAMSARRSGADLEERTVCSGRLKRKRDTLLPLLEHAIAYLNEFRVRLHVGVQFL